MNDKFVALTTFHGSKYWKDIVNGEILLEIDLSFKEIEKFIIERAVNFIINSREIEMFCYPENILPEKIKRTIV